MSIPLIQKPDKDDINTSIIAIKRNIERINMLLGLSNSEEIDTSMFATKDELQQAVTDLQPVNEVAVDNMHSVTSSAVAEALNGLSGFKFYCVGENGAEIKVSKGIFFYGNGSNYYCRIFTEEATVYPTNGYWGDPASGFNKIMIGFYKP